jgi:replicative DNA helicase
MKEEQANFAKYGKSFQEMLAQLIVNDRPFADQIEEVLDVNFFELKYLRIFVSKIFEYRNKYGVHPTGKIIASVLRTELDNENEAVQKQVRDYFARTLARPVEDIKYIKEISLDFCKKQNLKQAILKSVELLQSSSYDEIKDVIDNALKLGVDNDHGHDFKKDFEIRYTPHARNPVSTGWKIIDAITKSGLGKGELGVIIAPTGAGKSMVLAHLGAKAVQNGKSVVHYTLELSEAVTGQRYDSCISGVRLSDLMSMKDMVYERINDVEGGLLIKEYPTKSASVNVLRTHLEKLKKRNQKIDMILIDYADLLKPTTNYKEKRTELESIYESLRALAQEFNCPVWTASQTNRSGLNAEVVTMESISEAFSKCFVADFILSISRTIKDKNANTGRMFIAKNRNGVDGLVYPIFMEPATVKIKVFDQEEDAAELLREKTPKENADAMKEKYKSFKKQARGA